jgi:hypothetical protein
MEETKADEKVGCCSKGKCCGCKALAAVALIALGAVGGYFCGRHCAMKETPAASAPANPAK